MTDNLALPEVNGVTWSSDNSSVLSNTGGVVTRYNQDMDVTLTASFNGFKKSYSMTVLKDEGGADPDVPPTPPEESNKLVFHEHDYTSVNSLEQWYYNSAEKSVVSVEDGNILITATDSLANLADGSLNSTFSTNLGKTFRGTLEEDAANGTAVVADGFTGKYALEFTYQSNMTTHRYQPGETTRLNNTYYFITFGYRDPNSTNYTLTDEYADLRLPGYSRSMNAVPNYHTPYFYHADSSGVKKNYSLARSNYEQETTLRLVFDTVNRTIDAYMKNAAGEFELEQAEIPFIYGKGSSGVFNAMLIKCQEAYDTGSYLKISDLKVYEVLPDTTDDRYVQGMAAMEQMPEKLVDDYTNVTDSRITLPEEVGGTAVRWSSGNTMILGTDGTINRWVDAADTYLMGGITCTSSTDTQKQPIGYYKRYRLNIPAIDGAQTKQVYAGSYEEDAWTFGSLHTTAGSRHTVQADSLLLEKVTASDPTAYQNEKSYYAIQRFKGEERSYDDASRAALYADAYSGIYDLEFDLKTVIRSADRPVCVELGYYNGGANVFKALGSIEVYQNRVALRTYTSAEKSVTTELSGAVSDGSFKIRIDTSQQKIWAYLNGALVTDMAGVAYYNPLGALQLVNAFRMTMDKNLESGDTAEISNISFIQKMSGSIAEKNALLAAAQNLTVSAVTDSPAAVTGNLKPLPDAIGAYSIRWTSSDPDMVNPETGVVFGAASDTDVWLTAELFDAAAAYPVSIYKSFKLTVPAASAAGVLQYQLNKLNLSDYTKQPLDALYYNLNLPAADSFGTPIAWSSSNPDVLGHDGAITAGILTEPVRVTLTATLTANGASASKSFEVAVAQRGVNHVLYTGAGPAFTIGGVADAAVYGNVWLTLQKGTAEGTVSVCDSDGTTVFTVQADGDTPDVLKILIMPDQQMYSLFDGSGNVLEEGLPLPDGVRNIAAVQYNSGVLSAVEVAGDTYTLLKTAMEYVPYTAPSAITEDQQFPTDAVMGAQLQWSTDQQEVLTSSGVLTVPEAYTFVNITCTLTADGLPLQKTVNVPVPCSAELDLLHNAAVSASAAAQTGHPLAYAVDGSANTYTVIDFNRNGTYITVDLGEARHFNSVYFAQPAANIKGWRVAYSVDGSTWQTAAEGTMDGARAKLASFEIIQARYVRLYAEDAEENSVRISAFEAFLHTDAQRLMELDLEAIVLDSDYVLSGSITLPQTGIYGSAITWTSSHENILSSQGVYNQPATSTRVTLTARVESGATRLFNFYAQGTQGGTGPSVSGGGSGSVGGAGLGGSIVATPEAPIDATTSANSGEALRDVLFDDVTTDQWFYRYVQDLKNQGIVSGDGTGNFRPAQQVTREEFVKMLVLAAGIPAAEQEPAFTDVQPDDWYFESVMAAYSAEIVEGVSETQFGVGSDISRQDMAVMLWRVLERAGLSYEAGSGVFDDDAAVSDYAREAVYAMKTAGILSGYNNRFAPQDALTRAEAAKVISVLSTLLAG